ncbi:NTF2 fold immunity protein [Ulvibacter litoralis]|uniref:NTF2 fold immunity protein n=1 Tax=Ulvibacter litoralis TaxID=227084 RepID=A0A1G7JKS3_9FLAO|nr:NTF2 fold immunity protein [Ulvibacter litoralis]GHC65385.1 hypothetical protein GCM10008083_33250 [Ulvibacter litoralis]SDF25548.1 NTF2 fold immunity protein [Ulvibacter litoralis]
MKLRIIFIVGILFISNLSAQDADRNILDKTYADELLSKALSFKTDTTKTYQPIIATEEKAIKYAELFMFDRYGKETIEFEKPYQVYLIDNYWIIFGTLPKNYRGGVFEIVFDSRNGKIIMFGHGK